MLNNDTLASDLPFSFSYCDVDDTEPASCPDPRTASGPHGAVRYGQHLSPSHTGLPSCTPHTADVPAGKLFLLSAKHCHSLDYLHSALLPDALAYVPHSISFHREPAQRSLDVCRAFSDGWASLLPGKIFLPKVAIGAYLVVIHFQ